MKKKLKQGHTRWIPVPDSERPRAHALLVRQSTPTQVVVELHGTPVQVAPGWLRICTKPTYRQAVRVAARLAQARFHNGRSLCGD